MNITNILHQLSIHFISFHLPATCAGCPCWAAAGGTPGRTLHECLGTSARKACSCESVTEQFVKTLWLHRQRTFPLLTCAFLNPNEVDNGSNFRVNAQRKGRTKVITRLDGATVPKDATIMAFSGSVTQVDDPRCHDKIMPLNMDTSAVTENRNLHGQASIPKN